MNVAVRMLLAGVVWMAASPAQASYLPGGKAANIPLSVRQAGMGEVSLGGDVFRAWSNPANLALMDARGEVGLGGGFMFGEQSLFRLAGAWGFTDSITCAAFFGDMSTSFDRIGALGEKTGTLGYDNMNVGLAGAWRWNWLGVGLGLKVLRESFDDPGDARSDGAFNVDFGLNARHGGFMAGLALRNIGPDLVAPANNEPGIQQPGEARAGVGYTHRPLNLSGALEYIMPRSSDSGVIALGLEWWPVPIVGVRAGMAGALGSYAGPRPTFGLSASYRNIGFDYALAIHDIGLTNVVSLSYVFGPGERKYIEPEPKLAPERAPEPAREPEPKPEPVAAAPARPAGQKLNVAIADLAAQGVSASDAAVMADILRSEMVKTGQFNVIEKQNMDKVLAEHAFQQTGCTSEECAVKLGKLLNVQRMAVGSFGKLLDSYFLNVRVVDVETGAVIFGDSVEGSKVSDLKAGVKELAAKLAKQIR